MAESLAQQPIIDSQERRAFLFAGHVLVEEKSGRWDLIPIGGPRSGRALRSFGSRDEAVAFARSVGVRDIRQRAAQEVFL